jgi:hypothetical protein
MKKLFTFCFACTLFFSRAISQDDEEVPAKNLHWLFEQLKTIAPGLSIQDIKKKITKDPDLFNSLWNHFVNTDDVKNKVIFLRDLELRFKTFQDADSALSALGFSYDWNLNFTKEYETSSKRGGFDFGLMANGNVAFTKKLNPYDFLTTGLNVGLYRFMGGVSGINDSAFFTRRAELRQKLVNMTTTEEILNSDAYNEFVQSMKLSNQYMLDVKITGGLESNQDFSKKQYAYGIQLNLGAKAWNDKNALAQLNFFDYPFVITRWLTKTDESFSPYGATIPTVQFSLDYVKPQQDIGREMLTGNLKGYSRFHFETGFRTLLADIKNQAIFFNAGFRYYKEFNAPAAVKLVNLDRFSYFALSITSSAGLFISYSNGRLPFDAKDDAVYELGFNYNF